MKTQAVLNSQAQATSTGSSLSAQYLKEYFLESSQKNPQFSLRAFAKKLNITPSGLSQILSQKKRLSTERALEFVNRLQLNEAEAEYFLLLVQADCSKSTQTKTQLLDRIASRFPEKSAHHNLTIDQFKMISEWYGIPLLEVIGIIGKGWSVDQMAKYLGISKTEVELMIARFERLELIQNTSSGYQRASDHLLIQSNVPNDTIRAFYKNTIPKIQESIDIQSPKEKIIGAEHFAFDPAQMDEARAITREYFQKMIRLAQKGKKRTEIYQTFVNFYRMNPKEKKS